MSRLRLVVLTGQDSVATCAIVSALVRCPQAQVVGIVYDTGRVTLKTRFRNLRRHIRRQGWSYLWFRTGDGIADLLDRLAARVVFSHEVSALFTTAFPGEAMTLAQLSAQYGIPVIVVDNLNSTNAAAILHGLAPDLGVVLGTRILKRSTFSVPRIGCLNMHLGKVPEYRGTPPGFWELYDRQQTAGVTVHLVDDGLDTGNVAGEDSVAIHSRDTPETLKRRLQAAGRELLVRCVADFALGRVILKPQPLGRWPLRTSPTRRQRRDLERRLETARGKHARWIRVIKTACYLLMFSARLPQLMRAARRIAGISRACILLYHRVNEFGDDAVTTGIPRFLEHMLLLRDHYTVVPTSRLAENVEKGQPFPSDLIAIHFDDCYRDVFTNAKPVLAALNFPALMLASSGFVGTARRFLHDGASPWVFENLRPGELCELAESGFEIGSHSVNHIDLGQASNETITAELVRSRRDLEAIVGKPVTLLSFPFGRERNFRGDAMHLVQKAGYRAMFSAHGGYVTPRSNVFYLPRVSVSGEWRPLDLVMEIEGLSVGALQRWWRRARQAWKRPSDQGSAARTPAAETDDATLLCKEETT